MSDLNHFSEVSLTPGGRLQCDGGLFAEGNGPGLLALMAHSLQSLPPGLAYFHRLFADYLRTLNTADALTAATLPEWCDKLRPPLPEATLQALALPPIRGAEYLDGERLLAIYRELEKALATRLAESQSDFTTLLRTLSPVWKDVGKITFHLAENKGENAATLPFAFLATFIYSADSSQPRHLPLAAAIKAYAGRPESLKAILSPIQAAAEKSPFLQELLESRAIFRPTAWNARQAYAFLLDAPLFEEAGILVRLPNLWRGAPSRPRVSVTVDAAAKGALGRDALLNFSVNLTLNGEALTPEEIQTLLHSQEGLVRLRGQWVAADPERLQALLAHWQTAQRLMRDEGVSFVQGLRMLAGVERPAGVAKTDETPEMTAGPQLARLLREFGTPASVAMPPLPTSLDGILRPYQLDGVRYLWRVTASGLGCCLADDMGLGKTLQVLALLALWKNQGLLADGLPALLVVPATLLANWQDEAARFTPSLRLKILHPSACRPEQWRQFLEKPMDVLRGCDVAICSYGMLTRLSGLQGLSFPAVIADEAQAIKNPSSQQSRAVRALKAPRRLALTGTPVENRLTDLWCIFDFAVPGLLGPLKPFLEYTKGLGSNYQPLRKLVRPFILRRLKTDRSIIGDLPPKTEVSQHCTFSRKQAALYQHVVERLKEELKQAEGIQRKGVVLGALTAFKQICNHPSQYLGDGDYAMEESGKFQQLWQLAETFAARQEKLLVFTQFREMTGPLARLLEAAFGRAGLVLHGGTSVKERPALVRSFQREDGPPFFVLSLRAAGVGLNLTAATQVVHFDRWWNPAVENQASDRAYRIGQTHPVLVHKFICQGTLEERIDELIQSKRELAEELLGGAPEKLLTSLNDSELLDLVKLSTTPD